MAFRLTALTENLPHQDRARLGLNQRLNLVPNGPPRKLSEDIVFRNVRPASAIDEHPSSKARVRNTDLVISRIQPNANGSIEEGFTGRPRRPIFDENLVISFPHLNVRELPDLQPIPYA